MSKLFQFLFTAPQFEANPLIDELGELTAIEKRLFKQQDRTEQLCRWNNKWILIIRGALMVSIAGLALRQPAVAAIVDRLMKLFNG